MHLYLHIPFCRQACHYCDFHFSTNLSQKQALVNAMVQEIYLQKDYLANKTLETIYFGGGTPSLLSEREFEQIFEAIHQNFSVQKNAEITIEANPDDLSKPKIKELINFNVNRLSIGLQSFNEHYLQFLNRIHSSQESQNCVHLAQDSGIENISIDLIYGIQTPDFNQQDCHQIWADDLAKATALGVPHVSAYCLTIEEKTVFGNWFKKKKLSAVSDDFAAQQFETLLQHLKQAGFEQYEISNFARNQQYSKHNSSYWKQEEYLGIGPSAHSYNLSSRQYNVSNNAIYSKKIAENGIFYEIEQLNQSEKANDYLLTTLRTKWGSNLSKLAELITLDEKWKKQLELYKQQNLIFEENNTIYLTKAGKLLADNIVMNLFFEE